ncbi:MAG: acetyltransferase [Actinoallomurus sp.]|nr:acetyltransferase [Actinoallomurus sp.]
MNAVRDVTTIDTAQLAAVLGRAFADDPVWHWMFPRHPERMTDLFAMLLRHAHLPKGVSELATEGDSILAGALWDPPGRWKISLITQLRQAPVLVRVLGTRTFPVLRGLGELERAHPERPHWYLAILGTDPPAQGRGLGSALLRSRLSRCDAERLPAYLESSKESNVPYYERFGFRVTGEMRMPGGPPVWPMWREPR